MQNYLDRETRTLTDLYDSIKERFGTLPSGGNQLNVESSVIIITDVEKVIKRHPRHRWGEEFAKLGMIPTKRYLKGLI
jgi:hypothetical protein